MGSPRGKTLHKGIINILLDIKAGGRNADLTGIPEFLRDDHVERLLEIAIVKNQNRSMSAQFHCDAFGTVGCEFHQMLADRNRAREADLADNA